MALIRLTGTPNDRGELLGLGEAGKPTVLTWDDESREMTLAGDPVLPIVTDMIGGELEALRFTRMFLFDNVGGDLEALDYPDMAETGGETEPVVY